MASRRITLVVYPLYPGAASASFPYATAQVSQAKRKLITDGNYDLIETSLLGPTDPATVSWVSGGTMTINGPLMTLISATLGYDATAANAFLTAAAALVL
jgi:hypothetical protein